MTEDVAFLQAVVAAPDDDALRLVYADWLDDRGDPRAVFLWAEAAGTAGPQVRDGLDPRWLAMVDRRQAGWPILRAGPTKTYGTAVPAFIHNGSFYYAPIDVYADGVVNCWGFVDLPLFRGKLASGWVVPAATVGGAVSVFNLGQATVLAASWDDTPAAFERRVTAAVRAWNPTLEGLHDMGGTDVDVRDGLRYGKGVGFGTATPFRPTPDGGEVLGRELPVFEATPAGYRLRPWLIYADGLTQVGAGTDLLPVDAVADRFADGRLALSVPVGAWVTLGGLGRFQAGEGWWDIDPAERVREAIDEVDQAAGRPGAIARCRTAHQAYEADPGDEKRDALRAAYQAVPRHLRLFCGDMDTKDGPIRRILGLDRGRRR